MKNQNKRGFTLVELVIVIAVIAILAGVLIGTFATVISRANQNKAVQEAKAAVDEAYVEYVADNHKAPTSVKVEKDTNGKFKSVEFGDATVDTYSSFVVLSNGSVKLNDVTNQEVYFTWTNEGEYSIGTTGTTELTDTVAKVYVKALVETKLVAFGNTATYFQITKGTGDIFVSIEFKAADESGYTAFTNTTEIPVKLSDGNTYIMKMDASTGAVTLTLNP